jgi:predicted ABC-type ATPase
LTGQPRFRLFCGPNGSGKSTLMALFAQSMREESQRDHLGLVVNADAMLVEMARPDGWRPTWLPDGYRPDHVARFAKEHRGLDLRIQQGTSEGSFHVAPSNSYAAAAMAQWYCHELLRARRSFTFETVMSHRSKVALLRCARRCGYRTYVYWITTQTPLVNIARVSQRVAAGGHNVDPTKVVERYVRSLELLPEAVACADRAFLYDNTEAKARRVAEFKSGRPVQIDPCPPQWLKLSRVPLTVATVDEDPTQH